MPRERSLGTQWALRYGIATFVVVSSVLLFHYFQMRERVQRDAGLLLRLQANEMIQQIQRNPGEAEALEHYLDENAALGYRVLRLGFRVLDTEGRPVLERGSFEHYVIPLPDSLPERGAEAEVAEVNVGEAYPFFVMVVPATEGWVQVAVYTQLFARSVREIRNLSLLSIPIGVLLTTGIGVALARSSLRPIADVIATAEAISATRLGHHVPTTGSGDEIDRLARTFNAMTDRIASGVERMRRFSAKAAHELRTPVSLMRNRLEAAIDAKRDADADQALLEQTVADIDRLAGTIRGMLRLAHSEAGLEAERLRKIELSELLRGIVEFFEPLATEAEVDLVMVDGEPVEVIGDPNWLHQLFANLVDNAIKFTPGGGRITISIETVGRRIAIDVTDTGIGVPFEERERIFETFHRVDSPLSTTGSGLGLPLAREIARAHGGEIELTSAPGRGSRFRVWLPGSAETGPIRG